MPRVFRDKDGNLILGLNTSIIQNEFPFVKDAHIHYMPDKTVLTVVDDHGRRHHADLDPYMPLSHLGDVTKYLCKKIKDRFY